MGAGNAGGVIRELRPDWLVLRPKEVENISRNDSDIFSQMYSIAQVFDVSERVKSYSWLPGRAYLEYDQTYWVYRLKKKPGNSLE